MTLSVWRCDEVVDDDDLDVRVVDVDVNDVDILGLDDDVVVDDDADALK